MYTSKPKQPIKQFLKIMMVILLIAVFIRQFIFSLIRVDGNSMTPHLNNHQIVTVIRQGKIKRGSVIVFNAKKEDPTVYKKEPHYIKRVVGIPGDRIQWSNGDLFVNGKRVIENYISKYQRLATGMGTSTTGSWSLESLSLDVSWQKQDRMTHRVPKNNYFVLGDNRAVSKDSRSFGYIERRHILGKVYMPSWVGSAKDRATINQQSQHFFITKK